MKFRWSILKISLVVILSFSFVAISMGYLSYKNINLLLGFWGKNSTLSIYLKPDILDSEKTSVQQKLKAYIEIENIEFIDREKAAKDFKKSLGEYANGLLTQDELIDLLPESFVITLKPNLSTSEQREIFQHLSDELRSQPGVDEIVFGGEWIQKFSKLDRILRTTGFLLFSLLAVCTAVISAFMVSSLIEESKQEIEVYSLVGATRWHIYMKFFRQIAYFHIISLVIALLLSVGVFFTIKKYLLQNQGFLFISDSLAFFSPGEGFVFLVLLTLFIFSGAFLALNSSLRKLNLYAAE